MKRTYKYLLTLAFSGLLCMSLAISANAQHRGGGGSSGGGGGGGSRPSVSGGSSSGGSTARPSYNSGSSGNSGSSFRPAVSNNGPRPTNNNAGAYRPSSNTHVAIAPSRIGRSISPQSYNVNSGYRAARPAVNPGMNNYGGRTMNNNARSYVGGRGYIGAGGRGSVGVGGRGFYAPSYWRNHGYYHYYHGYYNTYYGPRIGFSIGFLPYGYYPFYYGDYQYYYSDGLFYQYDNNEYTVVEPPVGAEVTSLPEKAQSIVINGQQYYELNGVYYLPITKDDGTVSYEVAGKDGELNTNTVVDDQQVPQIGDLVESLPADCRTIKLNGEKYYVSPDGYYYQEARDANNNKLYKIVGTPDDAPEN